MAFLSNFSMRNDVVLNETFPLTVQQILHGRPDTFVERSRIRSRLKCQTKLLVARLPMMKRWHHFVVLKVLLNRATQNDLSTKKTTVSPHLHQIHSFPPYQIITNPFPVYQVVMLWFCGLCGIGWALARRRARP